VNGERRRRTRGGRGKATGVKKKRSSQRQSEKKTSNSGKGCRDRKKNNGHGEVQTAIQLGFKIQGKEDEQPEIGREDTTEEKEVKKGWLLSGKGRGGRKKLSFGIAITG